MSVCRALPFGLGWPGHRSPFLLFTFSISAFAPAPSQHFSFSLVPSPTLNPQLLCSGNRLLPQRSATSTLWDREAGTRVPEVNTDTATLKHFPQQTNCRYPEISGCTEDCTCPETRAFPCLRPSLAGASLNCYGHDSEETPGGFKALVQTEKGVHNRWRHARQLSARCPNACL